MRSELVPVPALDTSHAMYHSGDIVPKSPLEKCVIVGFMLVGAVFIAVRIITLSLRTLPFTGHRVFTVGCGGGGGRTRRRATRSRRAPWAATTPALFN